MKKYPETCFLKTIKLSFLQRKRCKVGMGVQTTDRKIGLGEFEGKEAEGGREGGGGEEGERERKKNNYLLQEVVVKISLYVQEI